MPRVIWAMAVGVLVGACAEPRRSDRGAEIDEIFQQAAAQPVPPGNVRITIDRYRVEASDREAFDVVIRYRDGSGRIQVGGPGPRHGMRVMAASENLSAALRAARTAGHRRTHTRQVLLLQPGTVGSLSVVETQARPYTVIVPVGGGAIVTQTTAMQVTGAGMQVRVRRADSQVVELDLLPVFHAARSVGGGAIEVEELVTSIAVEPGQSTVIMADQREEASAAWHWLGGRSEERSTQTILVLKAEVGR